MSSEQSSSVGADQTNHTPETPDRDIPVVAFLGPSGTFTEMAMLEFAGHGWCDTPSQGTTAGAAGAGMSEAEDTAPIIAHGHRIVPLPVDSPQHAVDAVIRGRADWACVAIESSVEGPVTRTFDALAGSHPLQIYREIAIPIAFSILVRPGTRPQGITTWSAHPVARPQVTSWIDHHLPPAEFVAARSNAAAAEMVTRGEVDAAAAPARAGQLYGLYSLADGVADVTGAQTRFVLVGKPGKPTAHTGRDRTSVVFNVRNEPGALARTLTVVSSNGVDLTRIESRPTRKALGEYRFYMDMSGHISDPHVATALQHLHRTVQVLRFLGSWPMDDGPHVVTTSGQAATSDSVTASDTVAPTPTMSPDKSSTATPAEWFTAQEWVAHRAEGTVPETDVLW
ncbi:prephenate dehydratase [uncultured Corynebacterium sp.]|uniref:prephenate dehydratase n=1 Tax=uncultured Corynebacterium sp. TaxID=159447 RepID=UPI0025EAAF3A|nr:prephenate dehydratase [uncultured Corynebacterium sp.]